VLAAGAAALAWPSSEASGEPTREHAQLVTNEFAHWNPGDGRARRSPRWDVTSGSLFTAGGREWSGPPDAGDPGPRSAQRTNSAVLRALWRQPGLLDEDVGFTLWNWRLTSTAATPPQDWDGVHVFLRYASEASLYYASVNRRSGTAVIKKKVPGGPSNGGTYYVLGRSVAHRVPYGRAQHVLASVRQQPDGSVRLSLRVDGALVVEAVDRGIGGPVIAGPGRVGLRGDNCSFSLADFSVTPGR
jgi:hypothetical protein